MKMVDSDTKDNLDRGIESGKREKLNHNNFISISFSSEQWREDSHY